MWNFEQMPTSYDIELHAVHGLDSTHPALTRPLSNLFIIIIILSILTSYTLIYPQEMTVSFQEFPWHPSHDDYNRYPGSYYPGDYDWRYALNESKSLSYELGREAIHPSIHPKAYLQMYNQSCYDSSNEQTPSHTYLQHRDRLRQEQTE